MVSVVVDTDLSFLCSSREKFACCYLVLLAAWLGCSATVFASNCSSCRVLLARLLTLLPVRNLVDFVFCYHSQCGENGDACLTASHA